MSNLAFEPCHGVSGITSPLNGNDRRWGGQLDSGGRAGPRPWSPPRGRDALHLERKGQMMRIIRIYEPSHPEPVRDLRCRALRPPAPLGSTSKTVLASRSATSSASSASWSGECAGAPPCTTIRTSPTCACGTRSIARASPHACGRPFRRRVAHAGGDSAPAPRRRARCWPSAARLADGLSGLQARVRAWARCRGPSGSSYPREACPAGRGWRAQRASSALSDSHPHAPDDST